MPATYTRATRKGLFSFYVFVFALYLCMMVLKEELKKFAHL
jgi:hypothetical protein